MLFVVASLSQEILTLIFVPVHVRGSTSYCTQTSMRLERRVERRRESARIIITTMSSKKGKTGKKKSTSVTKKAPKKGETVKLMGHSPKTLDDLLALSGTKEEDTFIERVEDFFGFVWYPVRRWYYDGTFAVKEFFRRVFRGYSNYEVYEMHHWHSDHMVTLLKDLRKTKVGHPCRVGCETEEEWDKIIDEMIDGFEAAIAISDYSYVPLGEEINGKKLREEYDKLEKKFDRGMSLFHEYYFDLWD